MQCGKAFLLYDDENPSSKPHLHVVISDPDENDCIVLVSVTTERFRSDTTTRLEPKIHPFIDNPSVIAYAYSKKMACDQLRRMIENGDAIPKQDASDVVVKRAQAGMRETRRAAPEVQECFLAWWAKQGQN
jgi:hypothetical protein